MWLHGGGLRNGAGSDYDARRLAVEQDVVVVTVNYRLGVFGFLDVPGLDGGGQFGLADQQAALRWVRNEIAAFGGDPAAVTVAGESGGADAVCAQLVSPDAAGLFDRAVVQSGTCSDTNQIAVILPGAGPEFATWKPVEVAERVGAAFATAVGCAEPALDCLRARPVEQILTASAASYFSPTVGDGVLPVAPAEAIAAGRQHPVPVLTGVTEAEGHLFVAGGFAAQPLDAAAYAGLLGAAGGARAVAAYPLDGAPSPNAAWSQVITDRGWTCPNLGVARGLARSAPVFLYEFADATAPDVLVVRPPDLAGAATHGGELPYLFDLIYGQPELTAAQQRTARTMRDAWGSFVRTGDRGRADWSGLAAGETLLRFGAEGTSVVSAEEWAGRHHCDVWAG